MQQDADVETQISSKKKKKKANITELSTRAIPPANPSYASTLHSFARRRSSPRRSRAQPIPRRITRKPQQEKKSEIPSSRLAEEKPTRRTATGRNPRGATRKETAKLETRPHPPPPTPGERGNAPLVLEGDEREALRLHLLPPPAAAADGGGGGGVGSVTRERECVCPYGGEEEMWGTRGRPRPKQTDQRPSRNEHVSWVSSLRCLTREEDGMGFGLRRRKASSTGLRDSCDLCPPRPTRRERERGRPRSPISSVRRARERSVARGAPPRVFLRCGWAMAISLDLLQ